MQSSLQYNHFYIVKELNFTNQTNFSQWSICCFGGGELPCNVPLNLFQSLSIRVLKGDIMVSLYHLLILVRLTTLTHFTVKVLDLCFRQPDHGSVGYAMLQLILELGSLSRLYTAGCLHQPSQHSSLLSAQLDISKRKYSVAVVPKIKSYLRIQERLVYNVHV